ncbi:MAG: GldG family protein [Puniceicoccales bacterium]|jgi:hypothetical protein|nr:GldG family protein [Puniceicoccales bacterium]
MGYWDTFAAARMRRRLSLAAFSLLLFGVLVEVNILSERHYHRFNIFHRSILGPECLPLAKKIGGPLQLRVVYDGEDSFSDGDTSRTYLRIFLENVRSVLLKGGVNFSYDFVSMAASGPNLNQWFAQCRPQLQPASGIFLRAGDRLRCLNAGTLHSAGNFAESCSPLEQSLAAAMRSIADGEQKTIYFLRGHGERSPQRRSGDGGLSRMCQWILRQGWHIAQIDGEKIGEISAANSLLAVIDPRLPLKKNEQAAMLNLLEEKRGRILMLLTPDSHPSIGNFLYHWNVLADPPTAIAPLDDVDDGVRVCRFSATAPYLRQIIELQQPVQFDSIRRICEDGGGPCRGHISLTPLLESSPANGVPPQTIAVAVESSYGSDAPIDIAPWKMVIVGGDFICNRHFALPGNRLLFQQLLFYLIDRETEIKFPRAEEFQINLTKDEMLSLAKSCAFTSLVFPILLLLMRLRRR